MKEKLTSRKFWMAILASSISIVAIFTELGGTVGTIFGIVGVILSSVFYILVEGNIDEQRLNENYKEIKNMIESIKKEGE